MSTPKPLFQTLPGSPFPLGPSEGESFMNFALFAPHAASVVLVIASDVDLTPPSPSTEIILDPTVNRTDDIWHISLQPANGELRYGYRVDGTSIPGEGVLFYPDKIVLDPCCNHLVPRPWGAESHYGIEPLCLTGMADTFDWQGDQPLHIPASETVIYEMHVRGFTRHGSSGVSAPGTYRGVIEKIPYLKDLGISAVELLPVTEWDETDNKFFDPGSGKRLVNFWGYNPLSFFALRSGLAAAPDDHIKEFKTMVRSLHQAGLEVILDLVFNHTGESDLDGATSGFRAIDNATYYMINNENGDYHNFTGCGNTVDCNHPDVREMILTSLRYLVSEMHVDGFRFDLASIFSRGSDSELLENPPLINLIADDPQLENTKIIAEAWDAAGLYQVGSFSSNPRWVEWNGRYRDDIRRFMAGHTDTVRDLATRIAGSSDLYQDHGQGPLNSVNFITSHDGFTLYDLVSYNEKANHANGEQDLDGEKHNLSWNSGHEGDPCPGKTAELRHTRIRTFAALLLFSQGIPMITAGDEFGRTQHGNNNCWCQDNELSWLDWGLAQQNQGLLRFFKKCIALRKTYPLFRRETFFRKDGAEQGESEISWQSLVPGQPDWSPSCRTLGFLLHGSAQHKGSESDFCIMINGATEEAAEFIIPDMPQPSGQRSWRNIINTAAKSPADIVAIEQADSVMNGTRITLPPMALIALQSHD